MTTWQVQNETEIDGSKYQERRSLTIAQTAAQFPGVELETIDNALRCSNCNKVYAIPFCAECGRNTGRFSYKMHRLKNGGAALFCSSCDEQFYAWECPSCNKVNKTNTSVVNKKSGCFIATACYGSPYCSEVLILKDFRDNCLLHTHYGRLFISIYYKFSPRLAKYIENKMFLKNIIKILFIGPIAKMLNNIENAGELGVTQLHSRLNRGKNGRFSNWKGKIREREKL